MTLDLLGEDYYSVASARQYWSISQYKRFRECEARGIGGARGRVGRPKRQHSPLVGNMVHSYFESPEAHKKFMDENADAMISKAGKTKGQLKSDFLVGQRMIERLEADKEFMEYYVGQKEVAVTGKIEGVEFKGKIDCLNAKRATSWISRPQNQILIARSGFRMKQVGEIFKSAGLKLGDIFFKWQLTRRCWKKNMAKSSSLLSTQ